MKTAHLSDRLKADFSYHSPRRGRHFWERIPGWATVVYYAQLVLLIFNSARIARKGAFTDEKWCGDSQKVVRYVESVGGRVEVRGMEGFAGQSGPFVFIANHMSMLDTFLLPGMVLPFHRVTFVIKEALLNYPVFGAIMRAVTPIAVQRQNPRKDLKQVLEEGQRLLEGNRSIIIFPQATRSTFFDAEVFNTLGVKLARKAGVPVVPVALKTDFQQNGHIIKEAGRVKAEKTVFIEFGSPIPVDGNGQETHRRVVSFLQRNLSRWGVDIKNALPAPEGEG
jgi:1-acyl-sn-glycerol-3-phosphate acyltransferase